MVKSNLIFASIAATLVCVVSSQEVAPTASIPSGIPSGMLTSLPNGMPTGLPSGLALPSGAVPTDIAAAVSSVMKSPGGIQSYISMASEKVGSLPSQYQASAYSALSQASKTLAGAQPKTTGSSSAPKTSNDSNNMYKPSSYLAAFVLSVAVVVGVL